MRVTAATSSDLSLSVYFDISEIPSNPPTSERILTEDRAGAKHRQKKIQIVLFRCRGGDDRSISKPANIQEYTIFNPFFYAILAIQYQIKSRRVVQLFHKIKYIRGLLHVAHIHVRVIQNPKSFIKRIIAGLTEPYIIMSCAHYRLSATTSK